MQKRVMNWNDFEENVLRRTIFGLYETKQIIEVRYHKSTKFCKALGSNIQKPMMDVNFLQKEKTMLLLEWSSLGQSTTTEFQETSAFCSI
jgi:hypothetical protein